MENNNQATIKVTVEVHEMTKDEIKQSKIESKQRKRKYRQMMKERRRQTIELRNNFKTMDSCTIHPSNIKIGNLEKCIYCNLKEVFYFMGTGVGHIDEKYELIDGEKVFIRIRPESYVFVDLDDINGNKDLREIRKKIHFDGIELGGKILECGGGNIRVNMNSLHEHPYFNEKNKDTLVSIKQLKKIVEEYRK